MIMEMQEQIKDLPTCILFHKLSSMGMLIVSFCDTFTHHNCEFSLV